METKSGSNKILYWIKHKVYVKWDKDLKGFVDKVTVDVCI